MKLAVIHGPNLNFTGIRQTDIYGSTSFEEICQYIESSVGKAANIVQFQSNSEGDIIDFIQKCHHDGFDGIVINAGAYTHYSYAIADAVAGCKMPVVEAHMSNIYARENFRHKSVIAPYCIGQISGFGAESYIMSINFLIQSRRK
ncbi:MAG: type II 3-dehydroquinate dehydratase [Defluviitaleaceae bacterium]|nr:type II 3-dehydroquinate dehydratase [Defluviitaleaceae bacterium]